MNIRRQPPRLAIIVLSALAIILPSITLIPLGGLYLWEKGYVLWWSLSMCTLVAVLTAIRAILLRRTSPSLTVPDASEDTPRPEWSPSEERAWRDVAAIAARVDPEKLVNANAIFQLGLETVETVAKRLHPERRDALWQFTMPEALAIVERASRRLSDFVTSHIPFGDRVTIAQVWAVYRWRGAVGVAERAYDAWRVIRMMNPATAATQEARERLSRAVVGWGREQVSRQLAVAFVEEVGRAAIDLYGGRLRIMISSPANEPGSAEGQTMPGNFARADLPLNILVGGANLDANLGVLALISHGANDPSAKGRGEDKSRSSRLAVSTEVVPPGDMSAISTFLERTDDADIVLWVTDANAISANLDQPAYAALAERFAARTSTHNAVIVPVVLHEGDLSTPIPLEELAQNLPKYSRASPILLPAGTSEGDKAARLLSAIDAAAPHARRVNLGRTLERKRAERTWFAAGKQAASAGGALLKAAWNFRRGSNPPARHR